MLRGSSPRRQKAEMTGGALLQVQWETAAIMEIRTSINTAFVNTTTKPAKANPPSLGLSLGQTSYSPKRRVSKAAEAGACTILKCPPS